jgi:hypothetical protein
MTSLATTDFTAQKRQPRSRSRQAGVRDLHEMLQNAESSRVLNLSRIYQDWRAYEEYSDYPLFENRALNRAIIIKQPVPPNDRYQLRKKGGRATKVLFPLDRHDYSLGGLYLFVGQKNFSNELARHFSSDYRLSERDDRVLQMLDDLPTLDPFLLYALLKSNELLVSEVYFQLTEADRAQIEREMAAEFAPLVSLCFPNSDGSEGEKIRIFIEKILNFSEGEELAALRESFKLPRHEFAMAMFAWRGLIYYKWRSRMLRAGVNELARKLSRTRVLDQGGQLSGKMLELSRTKILRLAAGAADKVTKTIERYDSVFENFVHAQKVERFRQFLTAAPGMFMSCGQSIAIMDHIMNFFERKAGRFQNGTLNSFEFAKILADLETELGIDFQVKLHIW